MTELRRVKAEGVVDSNNSTTTPLGAGATFTGSATEILDYGIIFINVYSDVASTTDGLVIEQSADGTNWYHDDNYTVPAGTGKNYSINPYAKYMRVKYTNGSTIQATFDLQTIIKGGSKPSSHRIQDSISTDDDAELVKAVLTGENGGGAFKNVKVTADGNLAISDNSSGLSIAQGDVTGHSFIHKFGAAPDFDTGDGFVTIWDGANDAGINEMQYNYSTSAAIDSIVSTSTDTVDIEIQGLDSNYDLVNQTITLNGQTRVPLTTDLIRVFRLKNVGSTDLVGNVSVYESTAISGGLPTDTTKIRAQIQGNNNQTLMAVYTIPAGYTGYMRDWYASAANTGFFGSAAPSEVRLFARPFGQVFQLKHQSAITNTGTSYVQHKYEEPEKFTEKTDIEMRANTTGTASGIAAGFDIVLVQD